MKKKITKNLAAMIGLVMVFTVIFNCIMLGAEDRREMRKSSKTLFWQMEQILSQNQEELEVVQREFAKNCLRKAKTAAYIIQEDPTILKDLKEMQKIASYLKVDEIHIFDKTGRLYTGTEPKYYDYTFQSGEQMKFFLPMLKDQSLQLCQEIMPNTAEHKMMQYAAVWQENRKNIIQIGMEPSRVLELTKKNELSYIFSQLMPEKGAVLYAMDYQTGEVLGSTEEGHVGKNLSDLGLKKNKVLDATEGFQAEVNGEKCFCIFTKINSLLVGWVYPTKLLYQDIFENTIFLVIYLLLVGFVLIKSVAAYLDRNIVQGIFYLNDKLQKIAEGNLDEHVDVDTTPEFIELSGHINDMVKSLQETTEKLSSALDAAQMPMGIYEYGAGMARVRVTRRVPYLLNLSPSEEKRLLADYNMFEKHLDGIRKYPVKDGEDVYLLPGKIRRYLKLESFQKGNSVFGVITDVTNETIERQQLELERDVDLLTGLKSRRGLYDRAEELFQNPEQLGQCIVIMIDADGLKYVNDYYGHKNGDWYLRKIADLIGTVYSNNRVLARLGGDEYVALFYGSSREKLEQYVEALDQTRKNATVTLEDGTELEVKFSMGWAYYPEEAVEFSELLRRADERMYQEKRERKQMREVEAP